MSPSHSAFTADEIDLLGSTVARFIADTYPFEKRHLRLAKAPNTAQWSSFADLGWLSLPLRDDVGGMNATAADLVDMFASFGRGLIEEPYIESVMLAAALLDDVGTTEQRSQYLPRVAAGELRLCLAHRESGSEFDLDAVNVVAHREGSKLSLSGRKQVIASAPWANTLVVTAKTAVGIGLFLVDTQSAGLSMQSFARVDGSQAADIVFDDVHLSADAQLGDPEQCAWSSVHLALLRAAAALCAEAMGIGRALQAQTASYLLTRKQFGQALAAFQALQHRFADMVIRVMELEAATSMATEAASHRTDSATDIETAIRAAKARIGMVSRLVAEDAVQLHGGIGYTEELIVGHYLRRLLVIDSTLGSADEHLAWLARSTGALT